MITLVALAFCWGLCCGVSITAFVFGRKFRKLHRGFVALADDFATMGTALDEMRRTDTARQIAHDLIDQPPQRLH